MIAKHLATRSIPISVKYMDIATGISSGVNKGARVIQSVKRTVFPLRFFSSNESSKTNIDITHVKIHKDDGNHSHEHSHDHDHDHHHDIDDDEMEQEDMFVDADVSLGHNKIEWGGPRRGGRFEEPTRFGDWERKGRCTDF